MATIDWTEWRSQLERGLDFRRDSPRFRDLFAPGAVFTDPANPPTEDLAAIEAMTVAFCPDWRQEITSLRHGNDWAVFEWTGSGSFAGFPDGSARGLPVTQTGMTIVAVDADGRITHYRDYLDRKEVFDQVKRARRADAGPIRVVQWTTGIVGSSALRAIIGDPALELVGVYGHSAAKVGQDAGIVGGVEAVGITVTDDIDSLLALRPDCLVYMPQWPVIAELEHILESGINVVTTARLVTGRHYGDDAGPRLVAAARRGGVSLFGTGMNPMYVPTVALAATGMCRTVEHLRITESVDCAMYGSAGTWEAYGFGAEPDHDKLADDLWNAEPDYREVLDIMAEGIGIELEDRRLEVEYAVSDDDRDLGFMTIPAGTVAGLDARWLGSAAGREVVELRTTWKLGSIFGHTEQPNWDLFYGYRIEIDGDPNVRLKLSFMPDDFERFDIGTTTALPAVNSIPKVVAAKPGVVTPLDLGLVTARSRAG